MTDAFEDLSPEVLLRQTAWLERLARELVADPDRARDVVQEAWLAALRHRHRIERLGPWLAQAVRHLAGRAARRESERPRREHVAARGGEEPAAVDVLLRVRQQHRVVAAVLALDEPYRATVLMRFFEDLPPRVIAARMAVPVATVRTRTRRALERLRAVLDHEAGGRAAWVAPLLAGTSWTRPAAATAAGAVMKGKLSIGVGLLLAVGLTVGFWPRARTSGIGAEAGSEVVGRVSRGMPAGIEHTPVRNDVESTADGEASLPRATVAAADDAGSLVIVRGRCVLAGTAVPLAGTTVTVTLKEPMAFSAREPMARPAAPPPFRTGADGRFEVSFRPGSEWTFGIGIAADGHVPLAAQGLPMDAAAIRECGDVEMVRGCRVRGRLTDPAGQPVADATISFGRAPPAPVAVVHGDPAGPSLSMRMVPETVEVAPTGDHTAITAADGSFAVDVPMASGRWFASLRPSRRGLTTDGTFEIEGGEASRWLDLVAEAVVGAVTGRVVDGGGAPVVDAHVWVTVGKIEEVPIRSDDNGAFYLPRLASDRDVPIRLQADKRHHRSDGAEVRWGDHDVRLTLERSAILALTVTEATTGAPVTDYGVRCFPAEKASNVSANDFLMRQIGSHADGRCEYPGLRPGPHLVLVEPRSRELATSWLVPIAVAERGRHELHVPLHPPVRRAVRVVNSDGEPFAGGTVQLVRTMDGAPVDLETRVIGDEQFERPWLRDALLLDEGTTDAGGHVRLEATPMDGAAVRVIGSSRALVVVNDVTLRPGSEELRIVLPRGARIDGVVRPRSHESLRLALVRADGRDRDAEWVATDREGRFGFGQVAAGDWKILLRLPGHPPLDPRPLPGLRDGERREVVLDVGELLPTRLRGRLVVAGGFDPQSVGVHSVVSEDGVWRWFGASAVTADGAFDLDVPPGKYRLRVMGRRSESDAQVVMLSSDTVQLDPGTEVVRDFRLERRPVRLRVLDAAGVPAAGRAVRVVWAETVWPRYDLETGADGALVIDPAPPSTFHLDVWPDAIVGDQEAAVRCGPVTPVPGVVDVRLPTR